MTNDFVHSVAPPITTNVQGQKSRGEIQMLAYKIAGTAIAGASDDVQLSKN
jgi:hypothetical protein